jgi:O-antigen/teichoic acid export membrane protein
VNVAHAANILKMSRLATATSPLAQRLATGGFWSLAGEVVARALSFATAIAVARLLGAAEFGGFALVQSTLLMLVTFATFGMGHTATRYVAAYRAHDPSRVEAVSTLSLYFAAAMGLLFACLLFAAAPHVASDILGEPGLSRPLRLVAPALLLFSVSGAMNGMLYGFEAFRPLAWVGWSSSLTSFFTVVSGALLWGLEGAIGGLVTGEIVRCTLVALLTRKVLRDNGMRLLTVPRLAETSVLWRFSLPLFLLAILNGPILWLCQTIVAHHQNGLTEVAFYNAAQKWMTLILVVPMAVSAAFTPVLASLSGNGERARFHRTAGKLALFQLVITVLPAAFVAMIAPSAATLFGNDFAAATPVIIVMIAVAPVFVLKHVYWQTMTSAGRAWTALAVQVLWAVVVVGLTWIWQAKGALGMAQAMLAAYTVALVASVAVCERHRRAC